MASVTVLLSCAHTRFYLKKSAAPTQGEDVLCLRCNKVSTALVTMRGYVVSCVDCTYSREHGDSEPNANRAATLHLNRHPSHTVKIYFDGKVRRTRVSQQIELPIYEAPSDNLGLRKAASAGQAMLRSKDVMKL
jgi:hypothetical protein